MNLKLQLEFHCQNLSPSLTLLVKWALEELASEGRSAGVSPRRLIICEYLVYMIHLLAYTSVRRILAGHRMVPPHGTLPKYVPENRANMH